MQPPRQGRDLLAQLGRGRRPVGECLEHGVEHPGDPDVAALGDPVGLDLLGEPGAQHLGHPVGGAPPHVRQHLAGEDEHGAAHRELLDHRPVGVERSGHVLAGGVGAGAHREVDARRLGRVQAGDRLDRSLHGLDPGSQGVPGSESRTPLPVGDLAHAAILAPGADRPARLRHDARVSAPTRSRLQRGLVILGIVVLAFNLRPAAVSVGPVLGEVSDGLGMTTTETGVLTSLPVLAFAVFGALAPRLARLGRPAPGDAGGPALRGGRPRGASRRRLVGRVPAALPARARRDGDRQRAAALAGEAALP